MTIAEALNDLKDGLLLKPAELEFDDADLDICTDEIEDNIIFFTYIIRNKNQEEENLVAIAIPVTFEVEFEWEQPTYVPYSSTSVLYDTGVSVYVRHIDAGNPEKYSNSYLDVDHNKFITKAEACKLLDCFEIDLDDMIADLSRNAEKRVEDIVEQHYIDNPPELDDDDYDI